jgi:hypothetical protein
VSLEGEDNPPDLEKGGFVADRVAEGRAKFGGKTFLPDLTEGEALHEVLQDGGVQGGFRFLCCVCYVV